MVGVGGAVEGGDVFNFPLTLPSTAHTGSHRQGSNHLPSQLVSCLITGMYPAPGKPVVPLMLIHQSLLSLSLVAVLKTKIL